MKKTLVIAGVIASLCASSTFASTTTNAKAKRFAPQYWESNSREKVVTIQATTYSRVFISVGTASKNGMQTTGINIKNCDNITHLNPGDAAVCSIGSGGRTFLPLSFSADKSDAGYAAYGTYEIE